MVHGLFVRIRNGFQLQSENLKVIEDFESLGLFKKYGFNICWCTFGMNIQIILKTVKDGETQIFLAEKNIDAESILNNVIGELIKTFNVAPNDQKEMADLLKKHGCCYF